MIVQKYGGSSLETTDKIIQVAKKIIERKRTAKNIVVAVSAMGKTTDRLIELAKEISSDPIERELDVLLSIGEQQTISLLSMALNNLGHKAISLTGTQARINTKGNYTRASIEDIEKSIINKYLEEGNIVVIAGFQGVNEKGDITTLGRGGSDTTAVALAAKFNCPCEIYTDVDGIYSIDPRLYEGPCKISKINYDIALEMARLGAKVVDKRALALGKRYDVPIYVGDSFKDQLGTRIGGESMEELKILSLMVDDNQVEVRIKNIPNKIDKLSNVFRILGRYNLDIGMAENNLIDEDINISFICSKEYMKLFPSIKKDIVNNVDRLIDVEINDTTRISIVGTGRINQAKVTSEIFDIVKESGIKYKKFCTSELSLSYYFEKAEVKNLINRLAKNFNL
ncbi:aspartate kinase [Tissierella sp. MB52-C2]|uniref:aspartate kinase n=1 Tax=Tissierella sp. MB52-C2 TaxID=3070999 RepID=UPI00280AC8C1|nr:aspartate kinase [Tissierella sp. MB52-C2]WMM24951.1 aspartate kinase [Tissierella sp. MB52-C2]